MTSPSARRRPRSGPEAPVEGDDPHTAGEELELDLMAEGASEAGEVVGDESP